MTTTKHEGKCCGHCKYNHDGPIFGSNWCKNPSCPHCHLSEPTGAGMREEFIKMFWELPQTQDTHERLYKLFEARLSRLHSQIVEEVEGIKTAEVDNVSWQHNKALDRAKDIINHAFKDL